MPIKDLLEEIKLRALEIMSLTKDKVTVTIG